MFKLSKSKNIDFAKLFHREESFYDHLPIIKTRRRRRRILKRLKLVFYTIIALGLLILIISIPYYNAGKHIYLEASWGKAELEQAASFVKLNLFDQAIDSAKDAYGHFDLCLVQLDSVKDNKVSLLGIVKSQLKDIEYFLTTAKLLSRGVEQGSIFAKSITDLLDNNIGLTYNTFSKEEKKQVLKRIYESGPELTELGKTLTLAYDNIENVNQYGVLWPVNARIKDLKEQLKDTAKIISEAAPLAKALPVILGYPEKATYLIALQNSDELRPTGGFIGTYGILEIELGDFNKFSTHDIYHLDMPVKDMVELEPPVPLAEYLGVERWFLRDANWSPDWPETARQIEKMYFDEIDKLKQARGSEAGKDLVLQSAPGSEFNGIIGITPEFITDLLAITGPIIFENVEYTQDNFTDLLEYKVEKEYVQLGIPSWQRKEVIGEIAKLLKINLLNLPASRWGEIASTILNNAREKNILVYSKNSEVNTILEEAGFSGKVSDTDNDFLYVVDANLAALKTDAVIARSINYTVEQGPNGLFADLTVNYAHQGGYDWKTTKYQSYTRIYAPLGSELIKAEGFENTAKLSTDLNRNVFSGLVVVEPGKIKSLTFKYKLPDYLNIRALNYGYSLYLQKQPGSKISEIIVDLHFLNKIQSYQTAGFSAQKLSPSRVRWTDNFMADKIFMVELGS